MTKKPPYVIIVGRQNVGKSTLFNALIKKKKAIVDEYPGLTRDILTNTITHKDASFTLMDSPGLDIQDSSELSQQIIENAKSHIYKASVIILLLENPILQPYDNDLYDIVRKSSIPMIIAVNKMDGNTELENMSNFYELGYNDILPISALNRVNISLLLDKIVDLLPEKKVSDEKADLNISIIGRPNAGKSTLLNSFMGEMRSIVSDVPGTTRDSIDGEFIFFGKRIRIIDTAGLRKKSKITRKDGNIEYFSKTRTVESINGSDVVIHLIDANLGITDTDKKICDEVIKSRKPVILAVNKWDMLPDKNDKTFTEFRENIIFKLYKTEDFHIISISAKEKQRIHKLLKTAVELSENAEKRIETNKLNKMITDIQRRAAIPLLGDRIKIYYATQVESKPPHFKLFVNNAELFRRDVMRFLHKVFRKELDIKGVPIIISIEDRKKNKKQGE